MQNLNYTKKETALIMGGRSQVVQPTQGDLFWAIWDYVPETEYNSIVDKYIEMEEAIHELFEWNASHSTNFVVNGRDENNDIFPITDAPSHPFPGRKPA